MWFDASLLTTVFKKLTQTVVLKLKSWRILELCMFCVIFGKLVWLHIMFNCNLSLITSSKFHNASTNFELSFNWIHICLSRQTASKLYYSAVQQKSWVLLQIKCLNEKFSIPLTRFYGTGKLILKTFTKHVIIFIVNTVGPIRKLYRLKQIFTTQM